MIGSGKAKHYLLYATGEIILVVIGILVALQINTWNEDNKDRVLEQISYCKFLEDLNQDESQLQQLFKDNTERMKSSLKAIKLLEQPNPPREKVVNVMRESVVKIRFKFRPSQSAFEDLKSSGKLNILTDQKLKKKLMDYYVVMEGYSDISDLIGEASLGIHFNPNKDFMEIGFQDSYFAKSELDSSGIDLSKFQSNSFPTEKIRKQLLSDAIFHLNTNGRKKELFKEMAIEIENIKRILSTKCAEQ